MTVQKLVLFDFNADDPMALVVGCVSMLIVLAALYRGGWRFVAHYAVTGLAMVIGLACLVGIVAAGGMFLMALFGPYEGRANKFLWGITLTAAVLIVYRFISSNNVVTRFLNSLFLPGRLPR